MTSQKLGRKNMVGNKLQKLSNTDLDFMLKLVQKEFSLAVGKSTQQRAHSYGNTHIELKIDCLRRLMEAIKGQQMLDKTLAVKW